MIIEQQLGQRAALPYERKLLAVYFFAIVPERIMVACLRNLEPTQESTTPGTPLPREVAAWLHIAGDGMVTGYTGKVDVGQGSRTSLAQVIADEPVELTPPEQWKVAGSEVPKADAVDSGARHRGHPCRMVGSAAAF